MKSKNIKGITIEIGGETSGLDKALKDVDKTTKDLQQELRGVNKMLEMDPKNVELIRQKEILLNKSIDETNKKLETLKTAQKQMQAKGIDENSEAYRDLQREIVSTERKLESLENEQKTFAAQHSDVAKLGEAWKTAGGKIKAAGEQTKIVSAACAGALAAMAGLAYKAGQAADEMNTLSKKTGMSTDALQKFQYASELIDVGLEDIAKGLAKVTKLAAADSDKITELGVSTRDSSGQLRDAEDIFYDVIDALGKIENDTERNAKANEIFGKSYQNLNPLIEGGADKLRELSAEFDRLGLSVDQDTLDKANELNDQIDKLKATWQQAAIVVGASLAENFGPTLDGIAAKIAEIANAFASLPAGVQGAVLGFLAFGAVLAPILIGVGQLAMGIGALMPMLSAIPGLLAPIGAAMTGLLANPIGLVIAAIVALVAAFVILWKKSEAFRNFWKNLWANIKQVVADVVAAIKILFVDLPRKMIQIGKNIVMGLWNGIKGAAGWLKSKISGFVNGIIGHFKSFFGIGSPSKEMADQIGKWIPAGMSEGIKANLTGLQSAVDTMGGVVLNAPSLSFAGMTDEISNAIGTGLAVQESGAGFPGVINVVVELGGTKVGEQIVNLYDYTKRAKG